MTLYLDSTINFGKYAGKKLKDLPTSYVQWLKENTNHTIKNRFKPEEKPITLAEVINIENRYRLTCTKIGRKLIYENIEIPF